MQVWGKTGSKLYGSKSGADYVDNPRRFRIFCEACIEAVRALPFGVGEDCIFVANDWHTAMLPVLLKVCTADGQRSMVACCATALRARLPHPISLILARRAGADECVGADIGCAGCVCVFGA